MLLVYREESASLEFFEVRKSGFDLHSTRRTSAGAVRSQLNSPTPAASRHAPNRSALILIVSPFIARKLTVISTRVQNFRRGDAGHAPVVNRAPRNIQRAHSTPSARIASARAPRGAVSNSLVGPKIVSVGRPSAAAT